MAIAVALQVLKRSSGEVFIAKVKTAVKLRASVCEPWVAGELLSWSRASKGIE